MLDIRRLRGDLASVKAGLARRGTVDPAELDRVADLDDRQRAAQAEAERLRAEVKRLSGEVARARREGHSEKADELTARSRAVGEEQAAAEKAAGALAVELRDLLLRIPNVPLPEVPDGAGAEDNPVLRVVGEREWAPHQQVPHWDVGAGLGWLDQERAARLSGAMFALYRGDGARLLRALTQYALDAHADAWEEVRPPSLVRTEVMTATGMLPKFADDAYHLERDDLWAIPTAEAPLTSLHAGEVLAEAELPRRYTAYTPCFRREAGSAGRDTRGVLRTHEFDKVELMAFCTEEQAPAIFDDILRRAEALLAGLGLTYRVVPLCTGDLTFSSQLTYDLEVYAPGTAQWLEVSSVSWFGDFQARRGNIRYRPAAGGGTSHVHTLNGSALAWSRVWPAVVESHRRPDGRLDVPEVLQPYLRGMTILPM